MAHSKNKLIRAMFDIRPVDIESGLVDFGKIGKIQSDLNLRKREASIESVLVSISNPIIQSPKNLGGIKYSLKPKNIFDFVINNQALDPVFEIKKAGGQANNLEPQTINRRQVATIKAFSDLNETEKFSPILIRDYKMPQEFEDVLNQLRAPIKEDRSSPSIPRTESREEEDGLPDADPGQPLSGTSKSILDEIERQKEPVEVKADDIVIHYANLPKAKVLRKVYSLNFLDRGFFKLSRKLGFKILIIGVLVGLGFYAKSFGMNLKNEVVKDGNQAISNLNNAESDLKNFNFKGASMSFKKAYEDFSKAGESINFLGSTLGNFLSSLPGTSKLKSAQSLVQIGQAISKSGQAMTEAISFLGDTGSILNPANLNKSNSKILESLSSALFISQANISKASNLLEDIDSSVIPDDKMEQFNEFSKKLPELKKVVDEAVDYVGFIDRLLANSTTRRYILLFQNHSELRPTGGFPGTYGIVTFQDGNLKDVFVDDIYNLDGQIKKNIIPPTQMQHITPTWGMRDANWFVDFPTSAKKIMSFYREITGQGVDGVITLSPDMISSILNIIGPIEMPDYDLTLSGDNFLASVQEEVEYGPNRTQPKQIVKDLAPRLLEKMYSADPDKWLEISNIIVSGLEDKDIMMYFNDLSLKKFSLDKGFGGEVKKSDSDYLMVNFTNIKGSKTDIVTDSTVKLSTIIRDGEAIHKLTIQRQHNGGDTKYGFYNRQNPAYVRVLVPSNAELIEVSGNDAPDFKPLMNYKGTDFIKDEDLKKFEDGFETDPETGVSIFPEADKKVFGFWLITDAGQTKTVEVKYSVPIDESNYSIYVQRQPGIVMKKFEIMMRGPDSKRTLEFSPSFNKIGNVFEFSSNLGHDVLLGAKFK